ncbi:serine hydrolase domain-containing protein [Nocardia testacea]|uniref:serine hydrolase domain-containing protein n=1 Tax=Nocardia testacea TaxID=248551 RepID=UPI0012F694EE|nr:serine hydrolase domain-containing protein [Nocardia testacea]
MRGGRPRVPGVRARVLGSILLVVSIVAAGCGFAGPRAGDGFPVEATAVVDRAVRAHMEAGLIPGAAVAIVDPELGRYLRAYGLADTTTGRPVTVDDHFRIGSVTKTFTATAVLRAAEQGRLSLDDALEKFVPGVPNGEAITIRDLLGMYGGVYDYSADPEFAEQLQPAQPTREWDRGDVLRVIAARSDAARMPRQQGNYSNSEYYLLGLVLERVTGKPVRQVLNDLSGDHGLRETFYPGDRSLPMPAARGYTYAGDVPVDVTERTSPSLYGAAGAMVSSVADLATYAAALGRGDLLKEPAFRARTAFTDISTPGGGTYRYGLGLAQDGRWLSHEGSVLGYTTQIGYLPERGVSVVVVVNQHTLPGTQLMVNAPSIWAAVVDDLYPGTRGPVDVPAEPTPPVPAVAEMDAQLDEVFDPDVPAAEKHLRVVGDDKDPNLVDRMASFQAQFSLRVNVDRVTLVRPNILLATTDTTSSAGKMPTVVPLVPRAGNWWLPTWWVCVAAGPQAHDSAACG